MLGAGKKEQLLMYAARREVVVGLLGLGLHDPARADRHWRWAQRYGTDPADARWELCSLTTRTLLWLGDPRYPLDGIPDSYWHGFQALVASVARAVLAPSGLSVAGDLDVLLAEAEVDPSLFPTTLSQRLDAGLPAPSYVDARMIAHDDVVRLAEVYAATSDREVDAIRDFLDGFTRPLLHECDLWLFSPGLNTLVRRPGLEDPPV